MSIDILQEKIRKLKNPLLISLEPTAQTVPPHLLDEAGTGLAAEARAYTRFCCALLEGLTGLVPGVLVKSVCFAALGAPGMAALTEVLREAKKQGYYVILDSMYAELGPAAETCAKAVFGSEDAPLAADSVTLNGYLGGDGIKPFLPYCKTAEKSVFILVKSSNRSSVEVQDLITGGRVVHTAMADLVNRWGSELQGKNGYSQVAAIASAARPEILRGLRVKYDRLFLLASGFEAQNATAKGVSAAFDRLGRGAAVCVSEGVTGAWKKADTDGRDYVEKAVAAAEKIKKDLGKFITVM